MPDGGRAARVPGRRSVRRRAASTTPAACAITSDEQLDRELDRASTLGVDFFKTYVRLPDRLQKRVVEFAHAQNRPVTSHELYPAVAFGIDGIEHLSGTSRRGYSPKHSAIGRAYQDVVELIAKSGVTLTPTIGILGAFLAREAGDRTLLFDPRLALFPLSTVAQLTDMAAMRPDPARDAAMKPYEATHEADRRRRRHDHRRHRLADHAVRAGTARRARVLRACRV